MTESEYNVQEGADVGRKDVNMFCNKNQFPLFLFGGPHTKLHGVRWLSKHEHIRFDPKIGHVICAICLIPCACDECTPTTKKPWIHGFTPQKKLRHQPVTYFTYLPMIVSFNNWNIITLSQK